MNPVRLVRTYPVWSFFLLACLVGWSPYIVTYLSGGSGAENLPLGPLVAAIVVVSCQGRAELASWWRRVRNWRASLGWYLLAVLAPAGVSVLIVLLNHGLGAPLPTSAQLADSPQMLGTFVAMLVFVGIGEETGWMAFAAPILLGRHRLLVAWVVSSAMRILWHLPLMIDGNLSWYLGIVGNAAFTMVMLLVFQASGGRWSLVGVWHAVLNATGGRFLFQMVTGADHERTDLLLGAVYSVVAVIAYLAWDLRQRRHETTPPPGEPPVSAATPAGPTVDARRTP